MIHKSRSVFDACRLLELMVLIGAMIAQSAFSAPNQTVLVPKNIINIILDDADYSDFGYNNDQLSQPDAITPHINNLRAGGRLFPNYYTASAYCSPTRVSVLTGCNPVRFGTLQAWPEIETVRQGDLGNAGLPSNVPQLGVMMQGLGKKTGHFGKWHVGSSRQAYRQDALGFNEHGNILFPTPPNTWSGIIGFHCTAWGSYTKDVDYLDEELTNMVGDFITRNHAEPDGFFVNFCPVTPHFPWAEPRNYDNSQTNFDLSSNRGRLLAMMFSIDFQIGRLVELIDSLGIREQTLIVVSSDNGGQQQVRNAGAYLYGTKGNLFEGGVKVSMIANWIGTIPANSINYTVISTCDLMPTFLDLFADTDPVALYPYIDGRSKKAAFVAEDELVHLPIYSEIQGSDRRTSDERAQRTYSLLVDNYRLTKAEGRNPFTANAYVLNDLQADPTGRTNIARTNPAIVKALTSLLRQERLSVSSLPVPTSASKQSVSIAPDPRFDIGRREATIVVDIDVAKPLTRAANILEKSGSFHIDLLPDQSVRWTIVGTNSSGGPLQQKLATAPLKMGIHRLIFTAQGYKNSQDSMHNQIYVDGRIAADTDRLPIGEQIFSIWSTVKGMTLGDSRLELKSLKFHTLRLWPDEID
ncbi:MAG: sulfatase-like hydrolase/transferase [Pirellulaceae bacterium]|nr:sulfatase-like hydrolase/transferase [Pirellulaceae bacterium]